MHWVGFKYFCLWVFSCFLLGVCYVFLVFICYYSLSSRLCEFSLISEMKMNFLTFLCKVCFNFIFCLFFSVLVVVSGGGLCVFICVWPNCLGKRIHLLVLYLSLSLSVGVVWVCFYAGGCFFSLSFLSYRFYKTSQSITVCFKTRVLLNPVREGTSLYPSSL